MFSAVLERNVLQWRVHGMDFKTSCKYIHTANFEFRIQ